MIPHNSYIKNAIKRNIIFILFGILFVLLVLIDTAAFNICIKFGEFPLYNGTIADVDAKMITYIKDGRKVSEEPINENRYYYVVLDSSQWSRPDNLLELDFQSSYAKLDNFPIKKISFRYLMFELYSIDSTNYSDLLSGQTKLKAQDDLVLIPMYDDYAWVRFYSNDIINLGHISNKLRVIKIGIVLFIIFLLTIFCLLDINNRTKGKSKYYKWVILLGIILGAIFAMSFLGIEKGSPDEDASAAAVVYYYNNNGLPDYRTEDAEATFSNYGSSRLKESTLYYPIAGKIGRIFKNILDDTVSSRLLNLILISCLFIVYLKKGKNNTWLLVGLVLTPQLWYLFSYTTSDAWDYFISICIVLCMIQDKKVKRRYLFSTIRGLLFAILFMGKENYYIIPLFAFLIYLFELIDAEKKEKKRLIIEYLIILLTTGIIYGIKHYVDIDHFQSQRNIYEETKNRFRLVTPVSLRSQGKTLSNLFLDSNLYEKLYKSFVGLYGWMRFESGSVYYVLMLCLYILLLMVGATHYIKEKNKGQTIEMIISFSMIVTAILIVAFHCWTYEYQVQGRYIFGILPCLMFTFSKDEKLYQSKTVEVILEGITVLSIYSFVMYGASHIIV